MKGLKMKLMALKKIELNMEMERTLKVGQS